MATTPAFDAVRSELERAGMEAWAARGALQLSLMDAGLEASQISPAQMRVVVEKLLPKQLQSQKVGNVPSVCDRIRDALALLADETKTDSADKVFQRLAG